MRKRLNKKLHEKVIVIPSQNGNEIVRAASDFKHVSVSIEGTRRNPENGFMLVDEMK